MWGGSGDMKYIDNSMRTFSLLILTFFLLLAIIPVNEAVMAQYDLTATQYRVLNFLVYLPFAGIWFTAYYGYSKLAGYARSISNTDEGSGFEALATGTGWLAWGFLLQSYTSLVLNAIASVYPNFHPSAMIMSNYIGMLFPLVAFVYIGAGARTLMQHTQHHVGVAITRNIQFAFVALGVVYCYLIFRNLDLHTLSASNNPYFLPVWLLVLTIIIPYLYAWFMGLLAAYEILVVAKHVKGVIYRQALRLLASGVAVVIGSFIMAQYLRTAVPKTGRLSLNILLLLIYLIYLAMAAGFVLVTMGANRLKKIEEV